MNARRPPIPNRPDLHRGEGAAASARTAEDQPLPYGRGSDRVSGPGEQLDSAKTPADKTAIQRQIDATDRQIDQLVYELYGLTEDEIRIVEEATRR